MAILTFSMYKQTLSESVDPENLTVDTRFTVGQMTYKFRGLGYKCYGYIETSHKNHNNFDYVDLADAIPSDILSLAKKYYKSYGSVKDMYLPAYPDMQDADLNVYGYDEGIEFEDITDILHSDKKENAVIARNKAGDKEFFVMFNNKEKYFYFLRPSESEPEHQAFVDLYIKTRFDGRDAVKKELEERGGVIEADLQAEREAYAIKKKEEEEKRRLGAKEKAEMKRRDDELAEYAKSNPDKFTLIKHISDLPEDFTKYAEYDEYIDGTRTQYDEYDVMRYVCNDDYSRLYKYKATISDARHGTYWGD